MKLFKSKSEEQFEEFYASVKLISGEEVLCIVVKDNSQDKHIIVDTPIMIKEIRSEGSNVPFGYKFEPWMKLADETSFLIQQDKVLVVSEIKNDSVIELYKSVKENGFKEESHPDVSRKMGYLSTVDKARNILEKLYKSESNS